MNPELDLSTIKRQLLETPGNKAGWFALAGAIGQSNRGEQEQEKASQGNTEPLDTSDQKKQGTLDSFHSEPYGDSGQARPINQRFHQEGSDAVELVRQQQLDDLQRLTGDGAYREVLGRLGAELLRPLATRLSTATAYAFGHTAYTLERCDVATAVLQIVIERNDAGELLPWAHLFHGLSLRDSGEITRTLELMEGLDTAFPDSDAARFADLALVWLHLNGGDPQTARRCVDRLQSDSRGDDIKCELDLVNRVLSTLDWLSSHPTDQLGHAINLTSSDGFAAAIDKAQLSSCGQLFVLEGWVVDPGKQLREICLVRGQRAWRLNLGQANYSSRPDLADLIRQCGGSSDYHPGLRLASVALPEEAAPLQAGEKAELFMVLSNGTQFCLSKTLERTEVGTREVKTILDLAIQDPCQLASPNLLHRVRRLWSNELEKKLEREAEQRFFGEPVQRPELSIIIPLYGRVDFMEYQLNWFNAWQRRKGSRHPKLQLIYVLDDPRLKQECLALAKRCNALYATAFELILNPENLGFAGANNRGANYAKATLLLLLNSDVLPARDDSIENMLRAMNQHPNQIGALGARLLFDNDAIQHQGMQFIKENDHEGELAHVWLNEHPLKGVKVKLESGMANRLIEMEAATAACLMVDRDLFAHVGGFSSQYIIGDFEDSDLCLKLRRRGLPILVDQSACFYHLERQSVDLASETDQLKVKIVAANALSHHHQWCSTIERLHRSEIEQ